MSTDTPALRAYREALKLHFPMERFGTCSCGAHIEHPRGAGSFNYGEWEASWAEHVASLLSQSPQPFIPSDRTIAKNFRAIARHLRNQGGSNG